MRLLSLVAPAAAAALLAGCGVYFVGDSGENGAEQIPIISATPTYDPNAVIFVVDVGPQFAGEQVDLRIDGVRVYRKNVTTETGATLTERVRIAVAPGIHTFFARVGTTTYNVNTSLPIDMGAQPCATVTFAYNAAVPQDSRVAIGTPDPTTCPR